MYKHKRLLTELYASSGKINVVQGSNFFMITADWNTFNLSYVSINFLGAHQLAPLLNNSQFKVSTRTFIEQYAPLLSNSHFKISTRTFIEQLALYSPPRTLK